MGQVPKEWTLETLKLHTRVLFGDWSWAKIEAPANAMENSG